MSSQKELFSTDSVAFVLEKQVYSVSGNKICPSWPQPSWLIIYQVIMGNAG